MSLQNPNDLSKSLTNVNDDNSHIQKKGISHSESRHKNFPKNNEKTLEESINQSNDILVQSQDDHYKEDFNQEKATEQTGNVSNYQQSQANQNHDYYEYYNNTHTQN